VFSGFPGKIITGKTPISPFQWLMGFFFEGYTLPAHHLTGECRDVGEPDTVDDLSFSRFQLFDDRGDEKGEDEERQGKDDLP